MNKQTIVIGLFCLVYIVGFCITGAVLGTHEQVEYSTELGGV